MLAWYALNRFVVSPEYLILARQQFGYVMLSAVACPSLQHASQVQRTTSREGYRLITTVRAQWGRFDRGLEQIKAKH